MTHSHNAVAQSKLVNPEHESGYLDDPRREFMRAIERVATEVVESLREDVFLPLVRYLRPPQPPGPPKIWSLHGPKAPAPPLARIMAIEEAPALVMSWKERWKLHRWNGRVSEARFNRLVTSVLEQWELGHFAPEREKPMEKIEGIRSVAWMDPIPWWYPKHDLDELPWSGQERLLMLGPPAEAESFWSQEYRDDVAKRSLEAGSWMDQLELVSLKDMLEVRASHLDLKSPGGVTLPEPDMTAPLAQMEPPPTLPIYNPTTDSGMGFPAWEERLKEIKQLYKQRVDEAFKAAGFENRPKKIDAVNYDRLVLHLIRGESINRIAEEADRDRRQISRALDRTAERVGIVVPSHYDGPANSP